MKKPLALNLIIVYIILLIISNLYFSIVEYGVPIIGLGTILLFVGLYYGLYRMQRDWMWVVVFLLGISTILLFVFLIIFEYLYTIIVITFVLNIILNVLSIYWLCANRNLFEHENKGKGRLNLSRGDKICLVILAVIVLFFIIMLVFGR